MKKVQVNGSLSIKASTKSKVFLGANTRRHQGAFQNNSPHTLYLNFDDEATPKKWVVKMIPGAYYELPGPAPVFSGAIFGVFSGEGKGFCRVTELNT